MLSKEIKDRLAQLNRTHMQRWPEKNIAPLVAPLPCVSPSLTEPPLAIPAASPASSRPPLASGAILVPAISPGAELVGPLRLEDVTPGRVIERPDGGAYWLIERRLRDLAPRCAPFIERYRDLLTCEAILLPEGVRHDLICFAECHTSRVLYLDIETTGLSGMRPLFLVGVMFFDGDDFQIRQFFARHYGEECHLLADLAELLPAFDMLVTFNGRRFDAPYIVDRVRMNGLALDWPAHHFDLLHESRRRWRGLLPNCRLVTLEQFICRRHRVDDIPSAEIPAAYHEFVHTEDPSKMRHVIHHNALDLLTMAELALFMLTGRNDWIEEGGSSSLLSDKSCAQIHSGSHVEPRGGDYEPAKNPQGVGDDVKCRET
jgi:uncharacterized protein YprB with RNaseH-like and TPR domain